MLLVKKFGIDKIIVSGRVCYWIKNVYCIKQYIIKEFNVN